MLAAINDELPGQRYFLIEAIAIDHVAIFYIIEG